MAILPVGISGEAGAYQIERSLRFNSADSAYLSRTPSSTGNRQKWTLSFWIKFTSLSSNYFLGAGDADTGGGGGFAARLNSNSTMKFSAGGGTTMNIDTVQVFRDPSAWYHIVLAFDTTQATDSNRVKVYVNGSAATLSATTWPSQNTNLDWNYASATQYLGAYYGGGLNYSNCYLTEIHNIDGQQLTPSSFGETDSDTGVWKPKAYSGSYGTNGFYLDFGDNSSTTALGYDAAGSNDWTPNNFSVTAGAGNDSLVDSPTRYGTDTGVGGEVRGNYATLNPLRNHSSNTLANGNLDVTLTDASSSRTTFSTIGLTSGKWYWEATVTATDAGTTYYPGFGVNTDLSLAPSSQSGDAASGFMYVKNGQKFNAGSLTSYGSSYTTNDVIGIALDMDAGTITFYKNGSSQGQAFSGITGTAVPCVIGAKGTNNASAALNFGARPFSYTAPSGFKALCTTNLPEPTIAEGKDYFNAKTYTGNADFNSITGVGFQPDLVWVKERSEVRDHILVDAVRGVSKALYSNLTNAEGSASNFTDFLSDGFRLGYSGADADKSNKLNQTYVGWAWKANGAGSSNTAGTISSTVSANTTAGFSVVTYTGTGSNATVGHGLGVAPKMVIVKNRNTSSYGWFVWHTAFGTAGDTDYINLNLTDAKGSGGAVSMWNSTIPSSTLISLGTYAGVNGNTNTYVAYCFAPVAGYSAFGSYTGNGSSDGPFVHLGFRPRFVMWKRSDSTSDWEMLDSSRATYNLVTGVLYANLSNAEATGGECDFTSNGFKIRDNSSRLNTNGGTYIYAAFAENPTKFALAR
jgi:hypothetical protein